MGTLRLVAWTFLLVHAGAVTVVAQTPPPGNPAARDSAGGFSLLDGLFRIDVARGIWPERRWRADLYLEARF
jgi:hypothetical protein